MCERGVTKARSAGGARDASGAWYAGRCAAKARGPEAGNRARCRVMDSQIQKYYGTHTQQSSSGWAPGVQPLVCVCVCVCACVFVYSVYVAYVYVEVCVHVYV